jgi:uncharacterized phage protein (TIGR02218 family)
MKTNNTALLNWLYTADSYVKADLYTITLAGGATLYWCDADYAITYNNGSATNTFAQAPLISSGSISAKRGIEVQSCDVTLDYDERHSINGIPLYSFARNLGFDGATMRIDRVFAPTAAAMQTTGAVGGWIRFMGRVSDLKEIGHSSIILTCTSWTDVLNTSFPTDCFQTNCRNVFGDAKCGVNVAALGVNGTVGGTISTNQFGTNLSTAGHFAFGKIMFTSGGLTGLTFTVRGFDGASNITLAKPLPALPLAGDTFTAFPGCDLSTTTCNSYNNLVHFRGEPFIPPPNTGLPT